MPVVFALLAAVVMVGCAEKKAPVSVDLDSEDNGMYLPGSLRADLIVAEADSAKGLIDTIADKAEFEPERELYVAVLNKLKSDDFDIYYNECYTDTQYLIRIYQKDEATDEYVCCEDIDFDKPFFLDVICSFSYDGCRYQLISSTVQKPFAGFEYVKAIDNDEVRICGNKLLNSKKQATSFSLADEENMFIRIVDTTFWGKYLPEDEENIILPNDFFSLLKLNVNGYLD